MEKRMSRLPSHPRIASVPLSNRWLAELHLADTSAEVIAITRSFVQTWTAAGILRLPFYCRPGRNADAKHIQELAFLLERAQQDFAGRLIEGLLLDRMLAFFAEASGAIERIARSHGEMPFIEGIARQQ